MTVAWKRKRDEFFLHTVCLYGPVDCLEVVRYLVPKCPEVLETECEIGTRTPLHELCKNFDPDFDKQWDLLEILAISEEAVKVKDDLGRTPFHWLSFSGGVTPKSLQVFVDKCPDVLSMTDNKGQIPLHAALEGSVGSSYSAVRRFYHVTVQCLIEASSSGVEVKDNEGVTPLQLACENDTSLCLVYQLVRFDPITMLSLESGTRKRKRLSGRQATRSRKCKQVRY